MPLHELMQPACLFNDISSRTHVEVVCVAENYLSSDLFKFRRGHRFNSGLSANRHEDRGLYYTVRCNKLTCTGARLRTFCY